ncbi:MAG TPA: ATP-binding protein [Ktedonosporobacter sp.]|jgi:two-component system sensor histidine kinase KdpD|nr:ATP-binding protein [Ktedonosporobacter sp.]
MNTLELALPVKAHRFSWQRYLLDSVLAFGGAMLVTMIMYFFQLYPRIPNISMLYLLVVLALASTRGRYAAILASLVAFLSFDYFLVPPLFVFTINRVEEWIALFVFLVTAILTSQLAVALRERALEASRKERETRILYDLVRITNRATEPESQLHSIALAVADALSSWGVYDCAILQPTATGEFQVPASAHQPVEQVILSSDEKAVAVWVMTHGRSLSLYDDDALTPLMFSRFMQRVILHRSAAGQTVGRSTRFIPLKLGEKVVAILRLRVQGDPRRLLQEERQEEEHARAEAPTSFFWTFLDQVTALIERANLQRENMHIEILKRTDTLRAALLSSVSHDLRTPLTAIKASASSLLQEDIEWDEEARRSFAQAIEQEADRLNRLVGNLLDMSRIEEGALRPEKEEYSLTTLIHDVLERLAPLLRGRDVRTSLPPDDLLLVELDYLEIDQVLTNLIENAVRYTPAESPIEVSARCNGEQVEISVADRGPGIPPSDLTRVFDKFYRVLNGPSLTGYSMGSGLGLAVCKGLIEAHGGRIWAELRPGGGLIIFVTLPCGNRERIVA